MTASWSNTYETIPSASRGKPTAGRPSWRRAGKGTQAPPPSSSPRGGDVNAKDEEDDFSCMHVAALNGFTEILDLLLRHGASLEALDDARSTPFAMAAFNFHKSAMRLLADRGANLMPVASDNVTPLNFACIMGNDEEGPAPAPAGFGRWRLAKRPSHQGGRELPAGSHGVHVEVPAGARPHAGERARKGARVRLGTAPRHRGDAHHGGRRPGADAQRHDAPPLRRRDRGSASHDFPPPRRRQPDLQRGQAPQRGGLPAPVVGGGVLPPADGEAPAASRRARDRGRRPLPHPAADRRELCPVLASGPRGRGRAADGGRYARPPPRPCLSRHVVPVACLRAGSEGGEGRAPSACRGSAALRQAWAPRGVVVDVEVREQDGLKVLPEARRLPRA